MNEERKKAKHAKDRLKAEESVASPIFRIDVTQLLESLLLHVVDEKPWAEGMAKQPTTMPFAMTGVPQVATWSASTKIQMMLGSFGGSYKNKDITKEDKRIQQPTLAGHGAEECAVLFKALNTFLDPRELQDMDGKPLAKKIMAPTWLFGCDPKMQVLSPLPNMVGQWRVLMNGEVRLVLMEPRNLFPATISVALSGEGGA